MNVYELIAEEFSFAECKKIAKLLDMPQVRRVKSRMVHMEILDLLEESKQVPHKAVCTTSYGDGESDDEDTDWRERYESTREAPYGCLTEDDMQRAIRDGDLDTIEDSPVLANITLGNMLRENPELEEDIDRFLRNHHGEDIPDRETVAEWQGTVDFAPTEEDVDEWNKEIGDPSMSEELQAAEDAEDSLSYWADMPDTELNLEALAMIEEQRSLSPKRQTRYDRKLLSKAFSELF